MRTARLKTPLRTLPILLLGLILVTSAGCRRHRNDPHSVEVPWSFHVDARLVDYNDTDAYEWETYRDWATVEFEAFDFWGEIVVQIWDDHDELIFERAYIGNGGDLYALEDTLDGDEGDWYIVITHYDVDGYVDLDIF